MTKAESALLYAENGLHLIPLYFIIDGKCSCGAAKDECKPGKHPYGSFAPNGLKNATTDPNTIRRWWRKEPRCNIGIRTGAISGIFVVDVDDRDGGSISLAKLESRHGALPKTLTQITGGGRHLIFNAPQGISIKNSQGDVGAGLDVRGDGGTSLPRQATTKTVPFTALIPTQALIGLRSPTHQSG
jgi:putative DNA primase/helicase